VNYRTN